VAAVAATSAAIAKEAIDLIEVEYETPENRQAEALTDKEKFKLKELGKMTQEEIDAHEVSDLPPKYRLACQFITRDENVRITFSGDPGGAHLEVVGRRRRGQ